LQEIRRVLASASLDQAAPPPDAGGPGSGTENPAPSAPTPSTIEHERFDPSPSFAEAPETDAAVHTVPRRRPALIVGAAVLALAAVAWYGFHRARPAPAVPASSGVVTDGAGRPTESPADRPVATPAATPAPTPAPAAAGKTVPPATKDAGRQETPDAETPRLRISAPPAPEASPAGPPLPTAAVRVPAGKPAAVPAPPAATARPGTGGTLAPGVLERQPAYTGQCSDGAAALGLCAPAPTPRREER
jgi:hypothetical protein